MTRARKDIARARALRQQPVPAEALLWRELRNQALAGVKFRRQHPIGPYFADFACVECRLVVEVDGESHLSGQNSDAQRTAFLKEHGWRILRFWNTEIYDEREAVLEAIYQACVRPGMKPR